MFFSRTKLLSILPIFSISSSVLFASLPREVELFKDRDQGIAKVREATKAYMGIFNAQGDKKSPESRKALLMIGRLAIASTMLEKALGQGKGGSESDRAELLDQCINVTDQSKPGFSTHADAVDDDYYYMRMACLAARAKMLPASERGGLAKTIWGLIGWAEESSQDDGNFVGRGDGGGILRTCSAVRSNLGAKVAIGGLYKPDLAVVMSVAALESQETEFYPLGELLRGKDYIENYYYSYFSRIENDRKNGDTNSLRAMLEEIKNQLSHYAKLKDVFDLRGKGELNLTSEEEEQLDKAIEERGSYPEFRKLENLYYVAKISDLQKALEAFTKSGDLNALGEQLTSI